MSKASVRIKHSTTVSASVTMLDGNSVSTSTTYSSSLWTTITSNKLLGSTIYFYLKGDIVHTLNLIIYQVMLHFTSTDMKWWIFFRIFLNYIWKDRSLSWFCLKGLCSLVFGIHFFLRKGGCGVTGTENVK